MTAVFEVIFFVNKQKYCFRNIDKSEKEIFNTFIENHSLGSVFQSFEWGALKEKQGWQPYRLVLEARDKITGAVTLLKKGHSLCPMVYSPRGPVVDFNNEEYVRAMILGMKSFLREDRSAFWKFDPELPRSQDYSVEFSKEFLPVGTNRGFGGLQPRSVWRIPLKNNIALNDIKKTARRQIKKAEQEGVKIRTGNNEDLPALYDILKCTAKRNGFALRSLKYYKDMWDTLHEAGMLLLFLAEKEKDALCAALVAPFGQGVWDIYAGTTHRARENGASYLLTWELLKWASQQGYAFYDLGGIPLKCSPGNNLYGLYQFKSRFGGQKIDFIGEYDCINSPLKHAAWQAAMDVGPKILKLWSKVRQ